MSKKLTLVRKVKLFLTYLKEQKDGVVVNCPYCQSLNVKFENQKEEKSGNKVTYTSKYTCTSCGSTCNNKQEWSKEYIKK